MLCINNIVIYPKVKAPKKIILKLIELQKNDNWIKIAISKCQNIYYTCSENHPINQYDIDKPINLLSNIYYIFQDCAGQIEGNSIEYFVIMNFLSGSLGYLRQYADIAVQEIKNDPMVAKLYQEKYLPVYVNAFSLSCFKDEIKHLKGERDILKKDIVNLFTDLKKEINSIGELFQKIVKNEINQSKEKIEIKEKSDSATQTQMIVENAWKNRKTKVDSEIQTEKKTCSDSYVQTDNIFEAAVKEEFQKFGKKKKNKDRDFVTMTADEYIKMVQSHNQMVKNSMEEGLKIIKSNFMVFFRDNPLDVSNICQLVNYSKREDISDAVMLCSIKDAFRSFKTELEKSNPKASTKIFVPPFCKFWTTVVLENIDKFEHIVMKRLIIEWGCLLNAIKRGSPDMKDVQLDIAFSYYCSAHLNDEYTKMSFMPPFFMLFFMSCRSVPIFLEIIKIFISNKGELMTRQQMIIDITLLFVSKTPLEILQENRKSINVADENLRVIYGLEDTQEI